MTISGFSIVIQKDQGITQALASWAKENKFELSGGKITAKEWMKTIEVLKNMRKGRGEDGLSVFERDVLKFSQSEQEEIMEAMGLKLSKNASNSATRETANDAGNENVYVYKPNKKAAEEATYRPWQEFQKEYEEINKLPTDKEKVIEYHKMNADNAPENYVIVDKKSATLQVYSADGKLLKTFDAGLGAQKGDAYLKKDRKMTSAGIYTIKYKGSGHDDYAKYYKDNIYEMTTEKGETGVAIHQIPLALQGRYQKHYNGTTADNRYSNGCVNLTENDFNELEKYIKGKGAKVYVLPEEENNYMTVKDGKLCLAQKEFDGQVMTSTRATAYRPIKFNLPEDSNDTAKEFAQTLESKKEELMGKLGLTNDEYNMMAELAFGIAERETKFGESKKYKLKEAANWGVSLVKWAKGDDSTNSRGLTQMKLGNYTDKETLDLLKEYGIKENNLDDPEKSAIATMIVLRSMYKNELPGLKSKMQANGVSDSDALMYLWNGKRREIVKGTATPDKNLYIAHIRKYQETYELLQMA